MDEKETPEQYACRCVRDEALNTRAIVGYLVQRLYEAEGRGANTPDMQTARHIAALLSRLNAAAVEAAKVAILPYVNAGIQMRPHVECDIGWDPDGCK